MRQAFNISSPQASRRTKWRSAHLTAAVTRKLTHLGKLGLWNQDPLHGFLLASPAPTGYLKKRRATRGRLQFSAAEAGTGSAQLHIGTRGELRETSQRTRFANARGCLGIKKSKQMLIVSLSPSKPKGMAMFGSLSNSWAHVELQRFGLSLFPLTQVGAKRIQSKTSMYRSLAFSFARFIS